MSCPGSSSEDYVPMAVTLNLQYPLTGPHKFETLVFLRCNSSHVYSLPNLTPFADRIWWDKDTLRIFASCPACPPTSTYPHASYMSHCPFCWAPMSVPPGETVLRACPRRDCWLGRAVVESGTDKALGVWNNIWQENGNMYFSWNYEERQPWITGFTDDRRREINSMTVHVNLPPHGGVPLSYLTRDR